MIGQYILCLFLIVPFQTTRVYGSIQIDLTREKWTAFSENQPFKVQGKVPGGIYSDLINAGILTSDLYYRFNDREYLWVALENWTYVANIELDIDGLKEKDVVMLECLGLDTVATILINGEEVGKTNNMFRRYSFDIKDFLTENLTEISISFESPVSYAQRMFDEQVSNYNYVVPPVCQYSGVCHANHIRKMQSSFSWDWGPAFPSVGIWQPIFIEAYDLFSIKYLKWSTNLIDGFWNVTVEIIFDVAKEPLIGNLSLEIEGITKVEYNNLTPNSTKGSESTLTLTFAIKQEIVEMWWPNGYGAQKLYQLTASFVSTETGEVSTITKRVAFRELELVQTDLAQGQSFYFKVNGVKFFAKGSNWIPAHVLPEKVTPEYTRDLLLSAKEAHMNMLRVWGGGIYEQESFYDIADEYGILLWHDFMFACSMYQGNPDFLDNVRQEIIHQVRRLQSHPSIALWAGNNENEIALVGNWYGTDENFDIYRKDYMSLYVNVIMSEVQNEDPSRNYIVSSPSNGAYTIEHENGFSMNPSNPLYGDMHYYVYNKDAWDPTIFPDPRRFVSEYGFQSFPSFESLQNVSMPMDWSIVSEFSVHRQRHQYGNLELLWQLRNHFEIPPNDELFGEESFKDLLYLMQIEQAESMRTETEYYRRSMTYVDPDTGLGMTMGALYWQLNDVWPGASWATLEFGGKWKVGHYFAVEMFKPVLISFVIDVGGNVQVHGISDLLELKENLTLEISVQKWNTFNISYSQVVEIGQLRPQEAGIIFSTPLNTLLQEGHCSKSENAPLRFGICFITFKLFSQDKELIAQNVLKPYPKDSTDLQTPTLSVINVRKIPMTDQKSPVYKSSFEVDVQTDQVAVYVWIETIGISGHFDRNGFLLSTPSATLKYFAKSDTLTPEVLQRSISVRSYKNSFT